MKIETLAQLFHHNVSTFNKPDLLTYRNNDDQYVTMSSLEFKENVISCAQGLTKLGVKANTKIIVLSENCPQWHITDFACHLIGAVIVPIFPTLVHQQIEYIIDNSESEFIAVSTKVQLDKIDHIQNHRDKIKKIIIFKSIDEKRDDVLFFEQILETGRKNSDPDFYAQAIHKAKPNDLATIIYTSGTTGVPKGVMLSHKNFVSNMSSCTAYITLDETDRGLSFLPLSHAFERTVDYAYFHKGVSIVYSTKIENVSEDLKKKQPTIMASVPRFFEKVKSKIEIKAAEGGALKTLLLNWSIKIGYRYGMKKMRGEKVGFFLRRNFNLADKLLLSKIRKSIGGKIRYFICGGAPLSADVAKFFFSARLLILEGYGLTETSPIITSNPPANLKFATVGKLIPGVEVKIADDGEILAKGPNIMLGYYKMPDETKKVLSNGWFYTGDIGTLDDEGYLSITGRKKQLIVTSVGKKIAPEHIEKELENSRFIEHVVLIGEKRRFISALIVPDFENLSLFAKEKQIQYSDNEELIANPKIIRLVERAVEHHQKDLANYQKVKKFTLLAKPFTIEDGQLTPTLKVKRKVVLDENSDLIEKMYQMPQSNN